jgi:hypothetical protein
MGRTTSSGDRSQQGYKSTIPLRATLGSLLDLVAEHPELDTETNRKKVGILLAEMGIVVVDEQ